MTILTLPVEDAVANGYKNIAPQEKKAIDSAVNLLLEKILKEKQNANLFKLAEQLTDEATKTMEQVGRDVAARFAQ